MFQKSVYPRFMLILFVLSTVVSGLSLSVSKVEGAAKTYDRDAAVKWATANNRNDGKFYGASEGRWCTTFVTKAMRAGGIDVPVFSSNKELASWLRDHKDLWEFKPKEQLEKGDLVFVSHKNELSDLNIKGTGGENHVVLVTGSGTYSAWNGEYVNRNFAMAAGKWEYEQGVHFKNPSSATPSKTTKIVSKVSDFCLDVKAKSKDDGAKIQQYICNGGKNQEWSLVKVDKTYFNIVSVNSGKCLDLKDGSKSNGASIQQWKCVKGNTNQMWQVKSFGSYYQIFSKQSGKCIDVKNGNKTSGGVIQQWECDNKGKNNNQLWKLNLP